MRFWLMALCVMFLTGGCVDRSMNLAEPAPLERGNAQKNLEAIRDLLKREPYQEPPKTWPDQAGTRSDGSAQSMQRDDVHPSSIEVPVSLLTQPNPQTFGSSRPRGERRAARTELRLSPLITTPSPDSQANVWHPVPPYTVFVPAVSASPGTSRCVPDALGGQRCSYAP